MPRFPLSLLFSVTIFLGAFLLFQVQPLIGKYILPWFGGSPAVWTTCMLFFQIMLLVGYAYAHGIIRYFSSKGQMIVHLMVLIAAICMLPIIPADSWVPRDPANPTWRILGLLSVCVGVPYVALAATGPLLQGWYSRAFGGASPYRLYALSNVASLLALLSYPFIVEPALARPAQARFWGYGLICFTILCGAVAIISARGWVDRHPERDSISSTDPRRSLGDRALWLLLPACASALLLAITNKICQDVAVVPLLWVLPLTLYLLSFIICFDSPRWYVRAIFVPLLAIGLASACWMMFRRDEDTTILAQIAVYCFALLACCMVCHGELYRLRPDPAHLTGYYLMIAAGGAIGGVLVAVVAPVVLSGYFELHISLFAAAILTLLVLRPVLAPQRKPLFTSMCVGAIVLGAALLINATSVVKDSTTLARTRNFYGVLSVLDVNPDSALLHHRKLQHGGVTHGLQFAEPSRRMLPTTYYGPNSGVGLLFRGLARPRMTVRVGIVGLGIGTVAAYAQSGDVFRFYEINPDVTAMARQYFSFLNQPQASIEIIPGDARISMQRESPKDYDVLILDAFSGDAIPVHLLTVECFELYLRHLRSDGVIAVHISSQHLNLAPVIQKAAEYFRFKSLFIASDERPELGQYDARWMLLSPNPQWNEPPVVSDAASSVPANRSKVRLWTDDDTNLFQILN